MVECQWPAFKFVSFLCLIKTIKRRTNRLNGTVESWGIMFVLKSNGNDERIDGIWRDEVAAMT